MPRYDGSEAARGSAANSLAGSAAAPLDDLAVVDAEAVEKARELDREYFRSYPKRLSYIRSYIEGETVLLDTSPDQTVVCVLVAYVQPGIMLKAVVFDRSALPSIRREMEGRALLMRAWGAGQPDVRA